MASILLKEANMNIKPIKRVSSYPLHDSQFAPHPGPPVVVNGVHDQRLPRTLRALRDSKSSEKHPRTLVICLDGTGDRFDNDNSNIVHFVSCLKKHDPADQVTYYQSGIGTYDEGGLQNGIGAAMDMAVGSGLGTHIKDAYKFLMQNYHDGDKICLFGFSRGAYTIRCLAGMLQKVGLLPASNGSQIQFAYDFYKDDSETGTQMSAEFKRTFCTDVDVYFVGLFDCVASVGFIPRTLPFNMSGSNSIHHFRHAIALDERRAKFKALQWEQPRLELRRRATVDNTPKGLFKRAFAADIDAILDLVFKSWLIVLAWFTGLKADALGSKSGGAGKTNGSLTNGTSPEHDNMDQKFGEQAAANKRHKDFETDVLEVWFMGAHADVGGGAVDNESRHMLSRIPLRWMLRQCFECDTGILFDTASLAEQGLDVMTMWPHYERPRRPVVGPQPELVEKYRKKTLAPLRRRSVFLPIGEETTIDDAPSAQDLSYILPSEHTEDYFDVLGKINDQLVDAKGWWILEFWPIVVRVLAQSGDHWEKKISLNRGRYRAVRDSRPKMHWTVGHMVKEGLYTIKARTDQYANWEEVA